MGLIQLLEVFLGLVEGIVPAKLREPMNTLAEEIRAGVCGVDSRVNRMEHDNEALRNQYNDLQDRLEFSNNKLRSVSLSSTDNVPATILRQLVDYGRLPKDDAVIREAIVSHHRDTNQKIQCIKFYRQITGLGLKESKDQVDSWLGL